MLKAFWFDLINNNKGATVYFHNWAGYDSILSLIPLLGLYEHGFSFTPIMQDGQLISLTVFQRIQGKNKTVLTIKDSLKMIPGALGKLAKDFQVPTQKGLFPHYFLIEGNIAKTLGYVGPYLPMNSLNLREQARRIMTRWLSNSRAKIGIISRCQASIS
jgi:hypothetical protein